MHKNSFTYEILEPYEFICILTGNRFELKKVCSNIVTKAAKEQLCLWPVNWSLMCGMSSLLKLMALQENQTERTLLQPIKVIYNNSESITFICLIGFGPANGRARVVAVFSPRSSYQYTY